MRLRYDAMRAKGIFDDRKVSFYFSYVLDKSLNILDSGKADKAAEVQWTPL